MSGGDLTAMSLAAKHVFISYAHSGATELAVELCQSFALDNGAYSAWKSGKEFDLEGYAEYVDHWSGHPAFDFCVMPDVIDGDENDNARMRAAWFKYSDHWKRSAPVWHMHEPLEVLRDLVNFAERVCIGSSGEFSIVGSNGWWGRMSEAMEIACDEQGRPKAKLHGLRMLDPTIFSHLPLASADSTNVARNCGIDKSWNGPYAPKSPKARALVMMERIESHASSSRWTNSKGVTKNMELFG